MQLRICLIRRDNMEYKYLNMREIIEKYEEEEIQNTLDLMNVDFVEDAEKEELVTLLENAIRDYVIEVYYMLSHEDLVLLNRMKENHGEYTFRDDSEPSDGPPAELESLSSLLDLCLIHPDFDMEDIGQIHAHVSREFIELFETYLVPERLSMAAYLDEAAKIIKGVLYYYGAVEIDKLYEIVSRNHGNMDSKFFSRVLSYKYSLQDTYASIMFDDKEYIVDIDFEIFYDISEIRRWNKGQGYKAYEKPDFMDAADPSFIEHEKEYEELFGYFQEHFTPDEEFITMYPHIPEEFYFGFYLDRTIEIARKTRETDQVIEEFLADMNFDEEKDIKSGKKMLMDYLNRISRWDNLGFANDEMPKLKLGRNVVHMKAYVSKKDKE